MQRLKFYGADKISAGKVLRILRGDNLKGNTFAGGQTEFSAPIYNYPPKLWFC